MFHCTLSKRYDLYKKKKLDLEEEEKILKYLNEKIEKILGYCSHSPKQIYVLFET